MQGGDISNSAPRAVLVSIDCFTDTEDREVKKWLRRSETVQERRLNLLAASGIHRASASLEVTFECFATDGADLSEWETELDRLGINPFRYFKSYRSVEEHLDELKYRRASVVGVIAPPEHGLRYGSLFVDLDRLVRL